MLSGSVLAGYLLGSLGTRSIGAAYYPTRRALTGVESRRSGYYGTAASPEWAKQQAADSQTRASGLWSSTLSQFKEEFDMIKSAVISALMSNLRDMAKQSMPRIAPQLEKAIDSATTKLGAQPLGDAEHEREGTEHYGQTRFDSGREVSKPSSAPAGERRNQVAP